MTKSDIEHLQDIELRSIAIKLLRKRGKSYTQARQFFDSLGSTRDAFLNLANVINLTESEERVIKQNVDNSALNDLVKDLI